MPRWPKGVSGNPAGRPRNPIPASLRALIIPYREDIVNGSLALARTAEDERVRLAAWIEIANRSDGKPKEVEEREDEETDSSPLPSPEESRRLALHLLEMNPPPTLEERRALAARILEPTPPPS